MSHWKDYDRLAAFSFLSHEPAAPFQRTPTDTIPVPMVPQVGEFRAGRVHQLNAHAVELPLEVGLKVSVVLSRTLQLEKYAYRFRRHELQS
jgi:hypothetical protein